MQIAFYESAILVYETKKRTFRKLKTTFHKQFEPKKSINGKFNLYLRGKWSDGND